VSVIAFTARAERSLPDSDEDVHFAHFFERSRREICVVTIEPSETEIGAFAIGPIENQQERS